MDRLAVNSLHLSHPNLKRVNTIAIPNTKAEIIPEAHTIAIQVKVLLNWMKDQLITLTGTTTTANLLKVFRTQLGMRPCWCRTPSLMLSRRVGWTSKLGARVISRYLRSTTQAKNPPWHLMGMLTIRPLMRFRAQTSNLGRNSRIMWHLVSSRPNTSWIEIRSPI